MDAIYTALKMDDVTAEYDPNELESQKGLAIVVYIFSFLFFIPILSNKDSAYAKTLANQSLTILAASFAIGIVYKILVFIPVLGWLAGCLLWLALGALIILKIVDTTQGVVRTLPYGFVIPAFK